MAFWGVEVKPGKPFKHFPYGLKGRLHVSQATLGIRPAARKEKSRVECKIGKRGSPVILCCLCPEKCESSQLNLEFDESREVVFSVIGPTSVHITGFFVKDRSQFLLPSPPETSDEEPFGEYIGDSSSEYNRSQDDDDDDDDSFIVPDSPCYSNDHNAGKEEEGKAGDVIRKRKRVLFQGPEEGGKIIENNIAKKVVVSDTDTSDVVDNKAVNAFFMSSSNLLGTGNNYKKHQPSSFAPIINNDLSSKELAAVDVPSLNTTKNHIIMKPKDDDVVVCDNNKIITDSIATAVEEECKKKKEIKVMSSDDEKKDHGINNTPTTDYDKGHGKDEAEAKAKAKAAPLRSTTLPNGLLIEDIEVGYIDGKVAVPGKKVTVQFTGKIKESEEVIDSNVGGQPLKFYLGSGQVMGGWDDGINGMRVGGKRRLTIPPSLWKKSERHQGKQIRSKASLVYEIQLLRVQSTST